MMTPRETQLFEIVMNYKGARNIAMDPMINRAAIISFECFLGKNSSAYESPTIFFPFQAAPLKKMHITVISKFVEKTMTVYAIRVTYMVYLNMIFLP